MPIGRTFDKLDEKLSSLIRSLGIITSLLFGIITITFNYLYFDWIVIITMFLLFSSFFANILYSIYIYAFVSNKNYRVIHGHELLLQLSKMTNDFYRAINDDLNFLKELYWNRKDEKIEKHINEILDQLKINFNENNRYNIVFSSITDIHNYVEYFTALFETLHLFLIKKNDDFSNKSFYFIDKVRRFQNELNNYISIRFFITHSVEWSLNMNPYFMFEIFFQRVSMFIGDSIFKHNYNISSKQLDYERKIKRCYKIFGLSLCICMFLFFYILMNYPFPVKN